MEEDEAPDPTDVGLLGANGIVLGASGIANAIEQFLRAVPDHGHPAQLNSSLSMRWCILLESHFTPASRRGQEHCADRTRDKMLEGGICGKNS